MDVGSSSVRSDPYGHDRDGDNIPNPKKRLNIPSAYITIPQRFMMMIWVKGGLWFPLQV